MFSRIVRVNESTDSIRSISRGPNKKVPQKRARSQKLTDVFRKISDILIVRQNYPDFSSLRYFLLATSNFGRLNNTYDIATRRRNKTTLYFKGSFVQFLPGKRTGFCRTRSNASCARSCRRVAKNRIRHKAIGRGEHNVTCLLTV